MAIKAEMKKIYPLKAVEITALKLLLHGQVKDENRDEAKSEATEPAQDHEDQVKEAKEASADANADAKEAA